MDSAKARVFFSFKTSKKEYVSGEDFKYLGRSYRLKVVQSKEERVKLQCGYLELFVKDKSDLERKENLVYEWYHEKATLYFFTILQNLFQ